MRKPGGYGLTTFLDSDRIEEEDTFTCCHCNVIVPVPAGKSPDKIGGWMCLMCMKPACARCNGKPCTPFEAKLERIERREQLLRAVCG